MALEQNEEATAMFNINFHFTRSPTKIATGQARVPEWQWYFMASYKCLSSASPVLGLVHTQMHKGKPLNVACVVKVASNGTDTPDIFSHFQ